MYLPLFYKETAMFICSGLVREIGFDMHIFLHMRKMLQGSQKNKLEKFNILHPILRMRFGEFF